MRRATQPVPQTFESGGQEEKVRNATRGDLPGIVSIHQKAFSNFFLTQLGPEFLRQYYSLVLTYHAGITLVSEGQNSLKGFACGFVDPVDFYRLMWRTKLTFALPIVSALARHPSLITKVLYGVQRIHTPASEWPPRSCELSSIAVAPEATGNGAGKSLIRAFVDRAQSMDAHCVYLTTDADGNDAVNAFYRDAGFQCMRRFMQRGGRWMNEYVINSLRSGESCEIQP
jgi:ribosomal protein S18 acetylase RimI-like enzyme